MQLCQAFVIQFLNRAKQAHRWAFQRLIHWFDTSGGVTRWGKTDKDRRTAVIEDIHQVEEYLTNNKKASLREPTVDLELCYVTIWNIFEVECLLPPQSQPADEEEHGRLIGVRPLVPASSRECKKKVWPPRARTLTPSTTSSDFMPWCRSNEENWQWSMNSKNLSRVSCTWFWRRWYRKRRQIWAAHVEPVKQPPVVTLRHFSSNFKNSF